MTSDRDDISAAEKQYAEVFESEDRKINKEARVIFLKSFLKRYKITKDALKGSTSNILAVNTRDAITTAHLIVSREIQTQSFPGSAYSNAEQFGEALGAFMAGVRYGIMDSRFEPQHGDGLYSTCVVLSEILKERSKKKVKQRFIVRELQKIIRENRGKISDNKKQLLMRIAALFT